MLPLDELGEQANRTKIQIFGTDIQERAVESYTEAAIAGVSPARLKRFFVKADHGYQIQKFIRERCVFARHDLAKASDAFEILTRRPRISVAFPSSDLAHACRTASMGLTVIQGWGGR